MTNINLTPEQKKTLQLFSYYVQSHGENEANITVTLDNCNIDWIPDYAYGNSTRIDMYDTILTLIEELSSKDELFTNSHCEGRGELDWNIDCKEKKVKVISYQENFSYNTLGNSLYFDDVPEKFSDSFQSFIKKLSESSLVEYRVSFNGSGDSGYIDEFIMDDISISIPDDVMTILYDLLNNTLAGWEINEGSQGDFLFDLEEKVLELSVEENIQDNECLGTVLYFEF